MARPKDPKYELEHMLDVIYEYTDNTELPIIKEVCYLNNWCYDYVCDLSHKNEILSSAIKRLVNKKEAQLERGGLTGKYSQSMAIFSLKQLGWRDRQEIVTTDDSKGSLAQYLEVIKNGKKRTTDNSEV